METPPNNKLKLDFEKPVENNLHLPREVLCIIFSHLDKKSVFNSTSTCKLWFELIRSDPSLSGHICLKDISAVELCQKMKDSEWIWTRWPVLKTLELRCDQENKIVPAMVEEHYYNPRLNILYIFDLATTSTSYNPGLFNPANIVKHSLEIVDHKDCPNLEKIVHSSYCDLPVIFPQFRGLFDETNSSGVIEELAVWQNNGTKSIKINNVSSLKICLPNRWIDDPSIQVVERKNAFSPLFKEIGNSLQSLKLSVEKFEVFDNMFFDCEMVTELSVFLSTTEQLKNHNWAKFKNLRKFWIQALVHEDNEDKNWIANDLPIIVKEKIPGITSVSVTQPTHVFLYNIPSSYEGTSRLMNGEALIMPVLFQT